MMKNETLILTPNKNEMCGMYQLAKSLAKEMDGDHWICYNQGIPPVTKTYFPDFWRRQAMRYINWRNNATMQGADEYWNVTEREQKPRWTEKIELTDEISKKVGGCSLRKHYFVYIGRKNDYKNFNWLQKTMNELNIPLAYPLKELIDEEVHSLLSNAFGYVTASIWEGYGRPVMEAEALGIPAVAYDVGAHKRHIKKGICVPLDINDMEHSEYLFKRAIIKVWNNDKCINSN